MGAEGVNVSRLFHCCDGSDYGCWIMMRWDLKCYEYNSISAARYGILNGTLQTFSPLENNTGTS